MEDKKVDIEGLNADMSKFLDQFAPGEIIEKSPAQKINIEEDNELFIVGFNLMCDKDNKIKYNLDTNNIDYYILDNDEDIINNIIRLIYNCL